MKKIFNIIPLVVAFAILTGWIAACSNETLLYQENPDISLTRGESCERDTTLRLCFENEEELNAIIALGDQEETGALTRGSLQGTVQPANFVSLVSLMPYDASAKDVEAQTYYEALGYDTLVPNINFAKLLNVRGEMEVERKIVKITPEGTFIVPKQNEQLLIDFLDSKPDFDKIRSGCVNKTCTLDGNIRYINTFEQKEDDYTLLSAGNYSELDDDYFDDDYEEKFGGNTRSSSGEPNFNDFSVFSANRHTVIGKLIENIIGSSKTHTINYNSKRRIRGSFYFYNYGVYSEIGVKGWTDKKNWIGWSKIASAELRVGWRNVLLKLPATSEYLDQISKNKVQVYYPPKKMIVGGKYYYAAQLVDVNLGSDFIKKVAENGIDHIKTYIRKNYRLDGNANLDKAEAFILANSEKIYMIAPDGDVVKYGEKSYCHTFSEEWMKIDANLEWCNNEGFKINGEKYAVVAFAKFIYDVIKQQHPSLVSGDVYVCARLGDNWRGMKINKAFSD